MNKAVYDTAFLCGSFSGQYTKASKQQLEIQWKRCTDEQENYSFLKNIFYSDYLETLLFNQNTINKLPYQETAHYVQEINTSFQYMNKRAETCLVKVETIDLYVLPYGLFIYAFKLKVESTNTDLIIDALSDFREILYYPQSNLPEQYYELFRPLVQLYNVLNSKKEIEIPSNLKQLTTEKWSNLVENGNKLKLFHIMGLEVKNEQEKNDFQHSTSISDLLFRLGTLERIENNGSTSKEYKEKLQSENSQCLFHNWKVLALQDTVTFLGHSIESQIITWEKSYFRLIYIHLLFVKNFLFKLNHRFRDKNADIYKIEAKFRTFRKFFLYPKISYNFLPNTIYHTLEKGLEINSELEQIQIIVDEQKQSQEHKDDQRTNNVLLILTLITMFSAIWDTSCLVDQLVDYKHSLGSPMIGYRLVSLIVFILILIVFLSYKYINRKR